MDAETITRALGKTIQGNFVYMSMGKTDSSLLVLV
jgi:hypothetical protein